jgi:hypothetical protein
MVQREDEEDCGDRRNRIENVFGVLRGGSLERSFGILGMMVLARRDPGRNRMGWGRSRPQVN